MTPGIDEINVSTNYQSPPRSTRNIPPKRYDSEFESLKSRYPVHKTIEGKLSQGAMTYKVLNGSSRCNFADYSDN